ncbi:M14 family metallopeptidase [Solirubrobacter ginsenosidimutans]|uniref:M14 family metallopeptidase n=1 Tax=Solirubrobacter ginsenosidimutans TaxID=490573 RepID=A0A9X3N4D8_9ACTN|nr:M14 family metallopeptidase [Solirubrobacter ginsenosidimutans]MDA0164588.1 M14 family metallopeptidase [Solirubrobacter ginsenosidimutans]
MGAIATAVAIAVMPASALADDGESVIEFKLPNKAAGDQLANLGYDIGDGYDQSVPGQIKATIVVTPEQKAQLEAMGYPAVDTIQTQADVDALRAARQATIDAEAAAKAALTSAAANKSKSAAAGTVRAQHADYWEDAGGRWLSIEGTTTQASVTGTSYSGPQLVASWTDAQGQQIGSGNLSALLDPDVTPRAYLYHVTKFRLGDASTIGTPMPAFVRIAAPNGDVATLAVKKWVGNGAPQYAAGFQKDFITHYVDPQEGYAKITALAGEFSNIAKVSDLPNKTTGYQRKSQTVLGIATPYTGSTSTPATADQARAVVLTALAWGQEGGNDITAQIVNPGANNAPLSVSVTGKAITVNAATGATGAVTSTAAQVVAAINANTDAAKLVTAALYRTNAGAGVVTAQPAPSKLSDWLNAPATYPRGPQTVKMLRIGNDVGKPQGQKTGVFIYCQEHAREWGTPLVCLETAERLVRNYATDPETKSLVDGLDIFIVPTINADGAAYSMYDYNSQRKNMVNYCASNPTGNNDPYARNTWGVDLNRNFSVGSGFDGYVGGGTNCTGETFQGPSEMSEPEVRNEQYIQSTYSNIKFAMNVHSSGGYFMWPPGAYTPSRTTLPYPPYGTLNYFDQTASAVLDRIYNYRKTAILPQQTGPVADVLYSAAGNSADEAYYNHGIIGYDFEIGASKVLATGQSQGTGFQPCYSTSTPNTGGGTGTCNANLVNEGHDEGMEFANGNYALLASALQYANDTTAPNIGTTVTADGKTPTYSVKFTSNEASSIYYTTDGSTPTTASTEWKPNRPRELPDALDLAPKTTLKWIGVDFKGNTSAVKSQILGQTDVTGTAGGDVPATLALTLGAPATFGAFTPGVAKSYTATTTATVISTAGDATLSVADPSTTAPGRLVNGTFALTSPLGGLGTIKTWAAPTSNESVPVTFTQAIAANEALRTGTYSKTLTFTLSTTTP